MTFNDSYSIFAAKDGNIESLQQMMSSPDFQWNLQFALHECFELPIELINFIICEYF